YYHYAYTLRRAKDADASPALIVGRAADADVLLRAIESGAVKKIWPAGILSSSRADQGQAIRGTPVLGAFDDLEPVCADLRVRGTNVARIILTPSALDPNIGVEALLVRARKLGLVIS